MTKNRLTLIIILCTLIKFNGWAWSESNTNPDSKIKIRDPFESPLVLESKLEQATPASPLLKFSVSEFKLVGIVWGDLGKIAIVEAPDGKCYSLKPGEEIGKSKGKITEIGKDSVTVKNPMTDYAGRTTEKEVNLKLYKEEKQP